MGDNKKGKENILSHTGGDKSTASLGVISILQSSRSNNLPKENDLFFPHSFETGKGTRNQKFP
jgi:hypothetical protein